MGMAMSTTKNLLECYSNMGCVLYNILNTSFIHCLGFPNHQKIVLNNLLCSTLRLVGKKRRRKKRRRGGSQRTGKPQLDHPSLKTPSPRTSLIHRFVEVSERMRRGLATWLVISFHFWKMSQYLLMTYTTTPIELQQINPTQFHRGYAKLFHMQL